MKKLILFCLLLQITTKSYSQTYIPFPTDNAYWSYQCSMEDAGITHIQFMLFVNNQDTMINNLTYTKLMYRSKGYFSMYDSATAADMPDSVYGFLREENKNIYFLRNGMAIEKLLYNFNLRPGDTMPGISPTVYILDSGSFLLNNGIYYPAFDCSSNPDYGSSTNLYPTISNPYYIEGVGGNWGLLNIPDLPLFAYIFGGEEGMYTFFCFNNNATQVNFDPNGYPCNYIYPYGTPTSVITPNILNEIKAYPNPFTNELNIDATTQGEAMLYNNSGQMVLNQKLNGAGVYPVSDVTRLPAGLYYLIVRDNNGNVLKKAELSKL